MRDLGTLANQNTRALAINERGLIVGASAVDSFARAFLLTPVPEPATVAGLCVLGMMFPRRSTH
jgi:uncharacterized membrane protein